MSRVKSFLFWALFFVLLTAFFSGCSTEPEDDTNHPGTLPAPLTGTWDSGWDQYVITGTTLAYNAGWEASFTGTIVFVSNHSNNSGVIIVRYTAPPTHNVWNTDKPFHVAGYDYTAVYFQNLTNTTVQLANVINLSDFSSVDTRTREEAESKFTRGNAGKYINWSVVTPFTKE
jgi:hypothetical protein